MQSDTFRISFPAITSQVSSFTTLHLNFARHAALVACGFESFGVTGPPPFFQGGEPKRCFS
jgi:hypothetical protein